MVLARNGFGFKVADFYSRNEIDESEKLERGVYYTLCASYALVSLLALNKKWQRLGFCDLFVKNPEFSSFMVQLVRIHIKIPEYAWTTQKIFHLMNFVVNGLRAILFGLYKSVFLIRPKALEMVIMDLPGLLFFSTYTLLLLFWVQIYHEARSISTNKLRPAYYIANGIIYFTQVCIWIFIGINRSNASVHAAMIFFSVISFCAALGFLIYGGRLFMLLRQFPIESRGRQKKLYEVGFITGICSTCFLIRCVVVGLSAFDEAADVDVLNHPILNLIYYMLVEIVPSALVLFILRKLPQSRITGQYHPIN